MPTLATDNSKPKPFDDAGIELVVVGARVVADEGEGVLVEFIGYNTTP
jgi:hypothetical protein